MYICIYLYVCIYDVCMYACMYVCMYVVGKKPSMKADLAVYTHIVDASGQCISVSLILAFKLDFNSCTIWTGFCKSSHICTIIVITFASLALDRVCVCVCVCVCVRVHACMHACMYVCMYVCVCVHMYVHMYVRTYICTYVCMHTYVAIYA